MRFILSICLSFVLISFNTNGQSNIQNNNTLIVKGVAILKQTPEIIYATINIKIESKEYNDCQDKVMTALQKAKSTFINSGIEKDLIKTNEIGVSENREFKDGEFVKTGFTGNVSLIIESVYSIDFTQKLLTALKNDSLSVYYNIGFKLSETQKTLLRQKSISMAIEDAKEKARSIAESSNVYLIKINSIVYKDDDYAARNSDKDIIKEDIWISQDIRIRGTGNNSPTIDFNPNEIGIQKSVQIEWTIKEK
ncbi:MAG TPA: SIMPL domain-containing protein [Prolixibacteraceae bacterium]|nr:SIMPL domain-containing protein [Prolixibacteraceae bacterium]